MIVKRPFWLDLIEQAWTKKNVLWLMGIRRVGKTSLCRSIPDVEYFDCELPRTRQLLVDPEAFLISKNGKRIVLDEIHRLENPSEILKIAADHYPKVKIIATGSSTLGASVKFRDTLTGRKKEIWLTPMLMQELKLFGDEDIRHRFLFGGLPYFFEQETLPEKDFGEWIDAYWAKDIQELFRVGKRYSFQKFAELLLANSGGIFEASKFTTPCEVNRQTISNYLAILEETFVVQVIRPFSTHRATEIVMAPKVYGFDTGFVCYSKGWTNIRNEDLGLLWEQCVLNQICGQLQIKNINYWRDKKGSEIDFVVSNKKDSSISVIECKFSSINISSNKFALKELVKNISIFRSNYPSGKNFIVSYDVDKSFVRRFEDFELHFVNAEQLIN